MFGGGEPEWRHLGEYPGLGDFATLSALLPAEVNRSGMVAFSWCILCGLFRRHRHPLGERCFPYRLPELDARGDHAALVPQAGFGRRLGTDISAQDLLDVVSREPLGWPFYG